MTGSPSVITIPATPFCVPAVAELSVYFGFILAAPQTLDSGRNGPSLPHQVCCVGSKAELQNFVDFHQLVLIPCPLLRGEGGEYSASGSRFCRYALDVRAEC